MRRDSTFFPTIPHLRLVATVLLTAVLLTAVLLTPAGTALAADTEPPASPQAGSPEMAPPAEPSADAADEGTGEEEWFLDEEKGRRYRIAPVPRVEGAYSWIEEGKEVLMPFGAHLEVVRYDDNYFWVKDYERLPLAKKQVTEEPVSTEVLEQVEASYQFEMKVVDRLSFEEFGNGLPRQGQWRNGFDVGDMNGDGHQDIVFGPSRKGQAWPNVFLGDGKGNWAWWDATYPSMPYDYGDAEAADWNGDGRLDLAFGVHLRGLMVLIQDGEGTFKPWSEGIGLGHPGHGGDDRGFSSRAIDSFDWNGDGKLDLVALGEGPKGQSGRQGPRQVIDSSRGFLVYLNRGDGSWEPWVPLQDEDVRRPNFGDDFVIADFDHDQNLDVATVSRQMGSQRIVLQGVTGGKVTEMNVAQVRPNGVVSAVTSTDVDGDGFADLLLGYSNRELGIQWRSGIDILYGSKDLTWKRRTLHSEETRRGITSLATGDVDGDGVTDVVALTGEGEVWIYLGDGEGFFVREAESLTPTEKGCSGYGLHLVDLDGDGRDEVLASFAGEQTGFPGIPGLSFPGCKGQGSVRVWRPIPAPTPATGP